MRSNISVVIPASQGHNMTTAFQSGGEIDQETQEKVM